MVPGAIVPLSHQLDQNEAFPSRHLERSRRRSREIFLLVCLSSVNGLYTFEGDCL